MNNCIAIIIARGGSKRIPKKNIKNFLGIPIIKYSIDAALDANCFDEVMVSTDDEEIALVSKLYGASVPFIRSKQNSDDHSTTADVIEEVLNKYKKNGVEFTYCCCIYATAPFLTSSTLNVCFEKILKSDADTLVPVVKFSYPILRSFKIEKGLLKMNWPEYELSRSQDLPSAYHDCGQFYFLRVSSFFQNKRIFTDSSVAFEMDPSEVQDIDTLDDWKMAEMKYQLLRNS